VRPIGHVSKGRERGTSVKRAWKTDQERGERKRVTRSEERELWRERGLSYQGMKKEDRQIRREGDSSE